MTTTPTTAENELPALAELPDTPAVRRAHGALADAVWTLQRTREVLTEKRTAREQARCTRILGGITTTGENEDQLRSDIDRYESQEIHDDDAARGAYRTLRQAIADAPADQARARRIRELTAQQTALADRVRAILPGVADAMGTYLATTGELNGLLLDQRAANGQEQPTVGALLATVGLRRPGVVPPPGGQQILDWLGSVRDRVGLHDYAVPASDSPANRAIFRPWAS